MNSESKYLSEKPDATNEHAHNDPRNLALALDEGLDILELLAVESTPLSITQIVQRLRRSTDELFQLIQILEYRGFVVQNEGGYSLTERLFELALVRPPVQNLTEIALPVMRYLSNICGQSCHLVLPSRGDTVVVAQMETSERIGFSVRVGYGQPIHLTTSGATLYAFQPADIRSRWETQFEPAPSVTALKAFRITCDNIRKQGHAQIASGFITGITDVSAPVMHGNSAAAALTVPFIKSVSNRMPIDEVANHLLFAAEQIAGNLP